MIFSSQLIYGKLCKMSHRLLTLFYENCQLDRVVTLEAIRFAYNSSKHKDSK